MHVMLSNLKVVHDSFSKTDSFAILYSNSTNKTITFLFSISSCSSNLATIRIKCGVVQPTRKTMQYWFLQKVFSRLSSKKFNFCRNKFSWLKRFIISIFPSPKFFCTPTKLYDQKKFPCPSTYWDPQLINYF